MIEISASNYPCKTILIYFLNEETKMEIKVILSEDHCSAGKTAAVLRCVFFPIAI